MRNQNCACFIFVCDVADWLSYLFIYRLCKTINDLICNI